MDRYNLKKISGGAISIPGEINSKNNIYVLDRSNTTKYIDENIISDNHSWI